MVESKSKGSVRLDKEAVKNWEERIREVQKARQERQQRLSGNQNSNAASSG